MNGKTKTEDAMNTKHAATIAVIATLTYAAVATASNPVLEMFQDALSVTASGEYDEETRSAMQAFQEENGLEVTEHPDSETLSALEISPSVWAAVTRATGASDDSVDSVREAIADSMSSTFGSEPEPDNAAD